ncbi:MAG: carotenoid 1,2-hydratase [Planctomycetes bacterium]|nr:carotenoid 1,2-hydratase [Planctomycetota bacterium]
MRAFIFIALTLSLAACREDAQTPRATLDVGELLSAPADPRFERALEPRELEFPRDHGPHASFQTEWWYFTGNLADDEGREFSYQLTFFRRALGVLPPPGTSPWNARDVFMAHFAVGDIARERFVAFERFERGALGLAGAETTPWRVWTRDWSAAGDLEHGPVRLAASDGEVELSLTLHPAAAGSADIVLHGERGLSRKGAHAGNASYYYSIPTLLTEGTLRLGGRALRVRGASWFDREWSTSALEAGQVGWDWFALRFDDGSALMLYLMRREDGTRDTASSGTFVESDGSVHALRLDDFAVDVRARRRMERSGTDYPARWSVRVPRFELECEIDALLPESELALAVRYWEGPVRATAKRGARESSARGFVELTGY